MQVDEIRNLKTKKRALWPEGLLATIHESELDSLMSRPLKTLVLFEERRDKLQVCIPWTSNREKYALRRPELK